MWLIIIFFTLTLVAGILTFIIGKTLNEPKTPRVTHEDFTMMNSRSNQYQNQTISKWKLLGLIYLISMIIIGVAVFLYIKTI